MIMMYQIRTHELLLYIKIFSSSSWWYQSLMPFYLACELHLDDISPNEMQQGGQGAVTEVLRCRPRCVYGAPPPSGVENEIPLTNHVTMMWPEWEANWFSAELMWQGGCSLHLVESMGTSACIGQQENFLFWKRIFMFYVNPVLIGLAVFTSLHKG